MLSGKRLGWSSLVLVSIILTGCAIPGNDKIYSVDSDLGCMKYGEPIRAYSSPDTWVTYEPVKDQSFWTRWHYTWDCLTNYSYGRGWNNKVPRD